MNSAQRKIGVGLAVVAVIAAALAGCSGGESTTPSTTTTTTTPSPTEKALDPNGGNKFSPTVKAPGPITPAPGNLPGNAPKN